MNTTSNCPRQIKTIKEQIKQEIEKQNRHKDRYKQLENLLKERIERNKNYYRRRQAIVEHPYGTVKRQWGFNYIMTKKTIKRAEADVGLIFTAYNIRRLINIIGLKLLMSYLRGVLSIILTHIRLISDKTSQFEPSGYWRKITHQFLVPSFEKLIFGRNLIYKPIFVK